jgi:antitoxin component HigA of HigAB toxin-antitoxin module
MIADAIDPKKYGRLLAKHLPSRIQSAEEQDRLAEVMVQLLGRGELTAEERVFADLLNHLLTEFEQRWAAKNPQPRPSPARMLGNIMEFRRLRQADLVDVFGTQGRVSEVLAGKRRIMVPQARALEARFGVGFSSFL